MNGMMPWNFLHLIGIEKNIDVKKNIELLGKAALLHYIYTVNKGYIMALWEFRNLNKHGNYRKRIIHTEGALSIPGSGFGPSVMANRFKYKYWN